MRYLYLFAAVLCAATAGAQTLSVPANANEGATVTFTYDELPDALSRPEQVTVDFGDGTSLVTNAIGRTARLSITHVYADDLRGTPHTVTVTENDFEAGPVESTGEILIRNVPPSVSLSSSYHVPAGRFVASGLALDPGADSITARVNYGDGSPLQVYELGLGRNVPLNHVYYATGTYSVVVTVLDDDNFSGGSSAVVNVRGTVPAPQIAIHTFAGLVITGQVSQSYDIQKTDSAESTNWVTATTLTLTNNPQLWIDLQSTNSPKRFYRAVVR